MEDHAIRLGIVGAGRWGRRVISAVQAMPEIRLVRVASRNPETAAIAGPGCLVLPRWQDVVACPEVDAVAVLTPPDTHLEIASTAVAAGKAVLVEKPLTTDPREARQFLVQAEQARAIVLVDHIHLYSEAFAAIKARIHSGAAVLRVRAVGGNLGPFRADTPALWDYGPHDTAMCLSLVETEPEAVTVTSVTTVRTLEGIGQVIRFELVFPGAIKAEIEVGNAMNPKQRLLEVAFESDRMIYDDTQAEKLHLVPRSPDASGGSAVCPLPGATPLAKVFRALAQAVRIPGPELDDLRLSVSVTGILASCERQLNELGCPAR